MGKYQEVLDLILKNYFKIKNYELINAFMKKKNARNLKAHQKYGFDRIREFEKDGKKFYEMVVTRDRVLDFLRV